MSSTHQRPAGAQRVQAPAVPATRAASIASSPIRDILAVTARPEVISFAGGLPAPELFDLEALQGAFARALEGDGGRRALQYSTTEGHEPLRAALARRMVARGLPTAAEDVLVTTGSQQALTLAAAALVAEGDVVLVEEPSYLAALQCLALAGARLIPVPSGPEGPDLDALDALAAEHAPRLLYLVTNFQNPTGRTLAAHVRGDIAALAARHGFWLLEDDPYGELRFEGEPVAALGSFPGAEDRTVSVSSLSKVLAPGLRIGWVRTPPALRTAMVVAKQAGDLHTSTLVQVAVTEVLEDDARLDAHLQRLRTVYRERRDALVDGLPAALPAGSTANRPSGGMFVWARLPAGHDAMDLFARAVEQDVAFVPGRHFYAGEPDLRTLRLSFTTHPPDEIAEGLERLGRAVAAG